MKKTFKLLLSLLCIICLSISLMACGENYEMMSADVDQTLVIGDTYHIVSYVQNSKGVHQDIEYTSSNSDVASVYLGTVTAKSTGEATITISFSKDSTLTASFKVTVVEPTYAYSIKKSSETETIDLPETYDVTVGEFVAISCIDGKNNTINLDITSSDTNVMATSGSLLSAVGAGTCTITIKNMANQDTKTLAVTVSPKTYTITYVIDTPVLKNTYTLECVEEEVINLEAQAIEGYHFNNWYYDSEFKQKVSASTTASEDITIYASYTEIVTWTITYETKGSVPSDAQTTYTNIDKKTITLPTPTYYGHSFLGWYATSDYSGNAIETISSRNEGDVIVYAKWSAGIDLSKCTFSVLGDSISTYEGELMNNDEWKFYYPLYSKNFTAGTKVTESSQMWFHILEKLSGMTLDALDSASGAAVDDAFSKWSGECDIRLQLLYKSAIKKPNIVIVLLGINDLVSTYRQPIESFQESYDNMLNKIRNKYCKNAYVFVCTMPYYHNRNIDLWPDYNNIIRDLAAKYGCSVIELAETITEENYATYLGDTIHPNSLGQELMANAMYQSILKAFDIEQ